MKKFQNFFIIISIEFSPIRRKDQDLQDEIIGIIGSKRPADATSTSNSKVKELLEQKKLYMRTIKKLSEQLLSIFTAQTEYFKSVVDLLKYMKAKYIEIIGNYKMGNNNESMLANMCIDYDLKVFGSLTDETNSAQNTNTKLYHDFIQVYKEKHQIWFDSPEFDTNFGENRNTINMKTELSRYTKNIQIKEIELAKWEI